MTAIEITKYLYRILNKDELKNLISGAIFRDDKPQNSELQDIVINCLFLKSGHFTEIQNGQVNINCYCKNINGVSDTAQLTLISNKVIELLQNNTQSNNLFSYEILETSILKELQQNSMSFLNLKLQIHKY